jgi:hypothetical protein
METDDVLDFLNKAFGLVFRFAVMASVVALYLGLALEYIREFLVSIRGGSVLPCIIAIVLALGCVVIGKTVLRVLWRHRSYF